MTPVGAKRDRTTRSPGVEAGEDMPPIPKLRMMERVLAQDAAAEAKVQHLIAQMVNMEDWARTAAEWMGRAEATILENRAKIADITGDGVAKPPGLDSEMEKRTKAVEDELGRQSGLHVVGGEGGGGRGWSQGAR